MANEEMEKVELEPRDPDFERIHFNENFRRAKRNVLFWAAATILVSLGRPIAESDGFEIGAIATSLAYSQRFLAIGSPVTLFFMALGYVRADIALKNQHSGLALASNLRAAANKAQALIETISIYKNTISERTKQILTSGEAWDQVFAKLEEEVENLLPPDTRKWHPKSTIGDAGVYPPDFDSIGNNLTAALRFPIEETEYASFQNFIGRKIDEYGHKWLVSAVETAKARLANAKKSGLDAPSNEEWKKIISDNQKYLTENIKDLKTISSELNKFARRVEISEKAWFLGHDRWPVILFTAIAFVVAAWRLASPATLDYQIDHFFPRHSPTNSGLNNEQMRPQLAMRKLESNR